MVEAGNVLAQIVAGKRREIASRFGGVGLDALRARAAPTRLSLRGALARPGARFVMEVKKASPSGGAIRPGADAAALASGFAGAASAISVLTDSASFGGSLDDLRAVRRVFAGPILAKDFVIDPRQVVEARLAGADAVLAMLSVLDDAAARTILAEAARLGMDVLVECHDAAEVRRAIALGAPMIGINNRDLRSLRVDLATTERLAPLVPADRLVVAESGIASRADVARLAPLADAFLVGTALMRADRPAEAARALAFGRVKVCGVTSEEDAGEAADAGASLVGVVMVPGTPRAVAPEEAAAIVGSARERGARTVGVFRNERIEQVAHGARRLGLDAVQLHGAEDAFYVRGLRALLPESVEIWTVGPVGREIPALRPGADRTVFDTMIDGRSGGTGIAFDWSRIRGRPDLGASLLAGGLHSGNARAAAAVGVWALDVGSGVEARPGRKDPARLRAFFDALRAPVRGEIAPCA